MALFVVTVVKKNHKTYAKELLLGTQRVGKFYTNADDYTEFHYKERRSRRVSPIRYETATSKAAFHAMVREAANEQWMNMHILEQKGHGSADGYRTIDKIMRINEEDIIVSWDHADGDKAHMIIEDADFRAVHYIVSHTIDEINETFSASVSRSPS